MKFCTIRHDRGEEMGVLNTVKCLGDWEVVLADGVISPEPENLRMSPTITVRFYRPQYLSAGEMQSIITGCCRVTPVGPVGR